MTIIIDSGQSRILSCEYSCLNRLESPEPREGQIAQVSQKKKKKAVDLGRIGNFQLGFSLLKPLLKRQDAHTLLFGEITEIWRDKTKTKSPSATAPRGLRILSRGTPGT